MQVACGNCGLVHDIARSSCDMARLYYAAQEAATALVHLGVDDHGKHPKSGVLSTLRRNLNGIEDDYINELR